MLVSMTGFGECMQNGDGISAQVEIRTVNNRHFKLNCRVPEGYSSAEPRIESLLRKYIRRGTVYLTLQVNREDLEGVQWINQSVLEGYYRQLVKACEKLNLPTDVRIDNLIQLPGVVNEAAATKSDLDQEWDFLESVIKGALTQLTKMREDEGLAMMADLRANRNSIGQILEQIAQRAPVVVENYQVRLKDRLTQLLQEYSVETQVQDIVREVGVFADRADIAEEIVRLRSHLEQFNEILDSDQSNGKKLEFVVQEMFRETNTIGSKANDAEISRHVVEIKAHIERLREMVQNIE